MRIFAFIIVILIFGSCNSGKKTDNLIEKGVPKRSELSKDSKIFLGNRLFSEKTCITCHSLAEKNVGPSVVDIMTIYKGNKGTIETFLKGDSKPIVDTSSTQVAIMQANIDGFLRKVTDEELNAIATYMLHVAELNTK